MITAIHFGVGVNYKGKWVCGTIMILSSHYGSEAGVYFLMEFQCCKFNGRYLTVRDVQ